MSASNDKNIPTAGRSRFTVILFFVIAGLTLCADLVVKHFAFERVAGRPVAMTRENARQPDLIPPHDAVKVIPNVLSLKLTRNPGAVFGVGAGGRYMFIAVSLVAVAVIITVFWRSPRSRCVLHFGLALILA